MINKNNTSIIEEPTAQYWDDRWSVKPRPRFKSKFFIDTRNIQRLLKQYVAQGMNFLEIGCSPGKHLAWVRYTLKANVSGIDYSKTGVKISKWIFGELGVYGDIRCEDIFSTTFHPGLFDIVFSNGVIEHYNNPVDIVRCHVNLLKPGGKAIITIPNYGGIYGKLQNRMNPANLSIHNLDIMSCDALMRLAPSNLISKALAYPYGRFSPFLVDLSNVMPHFLANLILYTLNLIGHVQIRDIDCLCPILVFELTRKK